MNEIASTSDGTTLPGYVLSKWRIVDFADAEREFRTEHLREAALSARELAADVQDRVLDRANKHVTDGNLDYGAKGFRMRLLAADSLPMMLWLSLRKARPEVTREEAAQLITPENDRHVFAAILGLMGFGGQQPKKAENPPSDSTGKESTPPSESAA